jgi:hypothetical protein
MTVCLLLQAPEERQAAHEAGRKQSPALMKRGRFFIGSSIVELLRERVRRKPARFRRTKKRSGAPPLQAAHRFTISMMNPQRRNGALPHSPELALNRDALADEEDADVPDSINRARIGASTNLADTPAAIVTTAETMNTRFQPPVADNTDASGTSSAAVPFAV